MFNLKLLIIIVILFIFFLYFINKKKDKYNKNLVENFNIGSLNKICPNFNLIELNITKVIIIIVIMMVRK